LALCPEHDEFDGYEANLTANWIEKVPSIIHLSQLQPIFTLFYIQTFRLVYWAVSSGGFQAEPDLGKRSIENAASQIRPHKLRTGLDMIQAGAGLDS
jgi:hypothetical protein